MAKVSYVNALLFGDIVSYGPGGNIFVLTGSISFAGCGLANVLSDVVPYYLSVKCNVRDQ